MYILYKDLGAEGVASPDGPHELSIIPTGTDRYLVLDLRKNSIMGYIDNNRAISVSGEEVAYYRSNSIFSSKRGEEVSTKDPIVREEGMVLTIFGKWSVLFSKTGHDLDVKFFISYFL